MEDRLDSLLNGYSSTDQSTVKAASNEIEAFCKTDPLNFFLLLSNRISRDSLPDHIRGLCCTLVHSALYSKEPRLNVEKQQVWLAIDPNARAEIRNNCLVGLQSGSVVVRHQSASAIAKIVAIGMPQRDWDELIPMLAENFNKADTTTDIKKTIIDVMRFLCDDLQNLVVPEEFTNAILGVVVGSMDTSNSSDMREAGAAAMFPCLCFCDKNMLNLADDRNMIMNSILEACKAPEMSLREQAYKCLSRVGSLYYRVVEQSIQTILFEHTMKVIGHDDEDVVKQVIDFWTCIADEEHNLQLFEEQCKEENEQLPEDFYASKHYIKGALNFLMPLMTQCLCEQDEDEDFDDTMWTVRKAASVAIKSFSMCCGDEIVPHAMDFINKNINSPEWSLRAAAIFCFGCILEGPSAEKLNLQQATGFFVKKLIKSDCDPSAIVRDNAAWTLASIVQEHKDELTPDHLNELLQCCNDALGDEPRVAVAAALLLGQLASAFEPFETHPLANADTFNHFVGLLINIIDRPNFNDCKQRATAFEHLGDVCAYSHEDVFPSVEQLCNELLNRLETALNHNITTAMEKEQVESVVFYVPVCLQYIFQKMEHHISLALCERAMVLMQGIFEKRFNSAFEEAFRVIGAVANCYGATNMEAENGNGEMVNFAPWFEKMKPVLYAGLQEKDAHTLCVAAAGCMADFCRTIGEAISPYISEAMTIIWDNLKDPLLDISVKAPTIGLLADIVGAIGHLPDYINMFFNPIMGILGEASGLAVDEEDEEQINFINELLEAVAEAYLAHIYNVNVAHMGAFATPICALINRISQFDDKNDRLLLHGVRLLEALCTHLPEKMKEYQIWTQEFAMSLCAQANEMGEDTDHELLQDVQSAFAGLM
eukprot:TRINITY_DN1029_c0_g1_i1.p2 TRINITY_DN1029_c0_g1~~TRINITY_DN1029_c0_g1_i1.p2  ORF type:complete len:880 (-),score=329.50 TRINITY_DN1029_c0_g1_i1:3046-5685(-)